MLTRAGWAIHNHSSNDESVYELTNSRTAR